MRTDLKLYPAVSSSEKRGVTRLRRGLETVYSEIGSLKQIAARAVLQRTAVVAGRSTPYFTFLHTSIIQLVVILFARALVAASE